MEIGLYAEGTYSFRCLKCGTIFSGGKRAVNCLHRAAETIQTQLAAAKYEITRMDSIFTEQLDKTDAVKDQLAAAEDENKRLQAGIDQSADHIQEILEEKAELQTQLAAAEEALRWIPVGERLPGEGLTVFFCKRNHVYIGRYGRAQEMGIMTWTGRGGLWHNPCTVTHWRPIALPEKDEVE